MAYTFKRFETGSIAYDRRDYISRPIWSGNKSSLTNIYTSSAQSDTQKLYYFDVYNTTGSRAEKQFSIVYCDYLNYGSSTGSSILNNVSESKVMYSQYKQLLLNSETNLFEFISQLDGFDSDNNQIESYTETSEYIYVLNINRSRYKEKFAPGSWQLSLQSMNPSSFEISESKITSLVDETLNEMYLLENSLIRNGPAGQFYYVYSGSLSNGTYSGQNSATPFGIVYPDAGIIVLNGRALDASASIYTNRSIPESSSAYNAYRLFNSISGAMSSSTDNYFAGRTLETINSTIYFARVGNGEFNFSNNVTYYDSGSEQFIKPLLLASGQGTNIQGNNNVNRNVTYVTTVGLYNDNEELLAVAKLSKPVRKTSNSEMIIKIKLDY
jgi:hypothetical protein